MYKLRLFLILLSVSFPIFSLASTLEDVEKYIMNDQYEDAVNVLNQMANDGDDEAQFILGSLYVIGEVVEEKDLYKAFEWFEKSAEQGNIGAITEVANYYLHGYDGVVEKDIQKAIDMYKIASRKGFALASYSIGYIYYYGKLGDPEYDKARYWFEKAKVQGSPDAKNMLGHMYYEGIEVAQDKEKAVDLFYEASTEGSAEAQYALAQVLSLVDDDEEARNLAYAWAYMSYNNGLERARPLMENLESTLSKDNIVSALEYADQCMESEYQDC